jgi:sec-independent protein translocase protein TatA
MLIILAVLLLIFGANKIPQLGDALGKGIRNFKKSSSEHDDSIDVTPKAEAAEQGQLSQGAGTPAASEASRPGRSDRVT